MGEHSFEERVKLRAAYAKAFPLPDVNSIGTLLHGGKVERDFTTTDHPLSDSSATWNFASGRSNNPSRIISEMKLRWYPLTQAGISTTAQEFTFPVAPLLSVSGDKNVISTALAQRPGPFVETVSLNAWEISIAGFAKALKAEREEYPRELHTALVNMYSHKLEVEVECEYLALFNISHLIISGIDFPGEAGAADWFPYTLTAQAHIPYTLTKTAQQWRSL